ncbi:PREDICTED: tumor necrosis factor receptor superfamily member 10D-like [Ceratotherium simum simum]|uniref:Tumor necrosis factor receptor superfamily member 10D-like n=1 Tax=Ceratotherium simum simum TaxID=73337 RepID=A0ABM1D0M1_CERSS|nr:PREDICTED: tumor necrosis factor receptor superfamily member 10D-like [Ceratotherium simum simum]
MPLPGFSRRRRELGALPDLTRQRGPSAPAASGARAGRAPGPRPARGARPRLRGPRTLVFVVCSVLLPVSPRRGSWLGKACLVAGREQGELGDAAGCLPGSPAAGACTAGPTRAKSAEERGPRPAGPTRAEGEEPALRLRVPGAVAAGEKEISLGCPTQLPVPPPERPLGTVSQVPACHFVAQQQVPAASAMVTQQERVPQQLPAPQKSNHSLWEKGCPPGSRVSEDNKNCTFCTYGVDYTSHWSKLSSCLPCSTCKSDEEQIAPCTRTENTRCQCKRGTFHGEDSPEVCQKCSTRCPDGMVEATPCTARSDLKCVHQESGIQASGEAPVSGEPVTTNPWPPTASSPSSGNPWLVMGIVVGAVGVVLLLVVTAYYYRKRVLQGCGVDAKCMNRVFFWRSCPPRGPGALDNRGSPSTLASEQELEDEELTGVSTQSPGEAEHLLVLIYPAAIQNAEESSAANVGPLTTSKENDWEESGKLLTGDTRGRIRQV